MGISCHFLSAAHESLHPGSHTNELRVVSLPHSSCGILDLTLGGGNMIEQPDGGVF